jgi:hypothetical protein
LRAVLDSYAIWSRKALDQLDSSTILYDTVAIYLADPNRRKAIVLRDLNIKVTDDGMSVVSREGRRMDVATSWNSLDEFKDQLVTSLLGTDAEVK